MICTLSSGSRFQSLLLFGAPRAYYNSMEWLHYTSVHHHHHHHQLPPCTNNQKTPRQHSHSEESLSEECAHVDYWTIIGGRCHNWRVTSTTLRCYKVRVWDDKVHICCRKLRFRATNPHQNCLPCLQRQKLQQICSCNNDLWRHATHSVSIVIKPDR